MVDPIEDLTLDEYLNLLRLRGHAAEADKIREDAVKNLETEYEVIQYLTYGQVMNMLREARDSMRLKISKLNAGVLNVKNVELDLAAQSGDEVFIGADMDPEQAKRIMERNNLGWMMFKNARG